MSKPSFLISFSCVRNVVMRTARILVVCALFFSFALAFAQDGAYADDPPPPGTAEYSALLDASSNTVDFLSLRLADATSPLQLFESYEIHGGYVAAGVGMRNRGFGTITISDIPQSSTVRATYLYWDILANSQDSSFSQGQLNGQDVEGELIGSHLDPCWGNTNKLFPIRNHRFTDWRTCCV